NGKPGFNALANADLYDPNVGANGTWTATGSLGQARAGAMTTLLANGKVLVAGGHDGSSYFTSSELFDPGSGTWTPTDNLKAARAEGAMTLLQNGQVLIEGGFDNSAVTSDAELFDPTSGANGTWSTTQAMTSARSRQSATLLANGQVLVAGGLDLTNHGIAS